MLQKQLLKPHENKKQYSPPSAFGAPTLWACDKLILASQLASASVNQNVFCRYLTW
jgi:hypothetical protein